MDNMEFKTEQRLQNIVRENRSISNEEYSKLITAFDNLGILRKIPGVLGNGRDERTFYLKRDEFAAKMEWINKFMRSKGFTEDMFRNVTDYVISSDDYDYYYEYKTPTQYKKDEEAREALKKRTDPDDIDIPQ